MRKKRERGSNDKLGGKEKRNNWGHKTEGKVKVGKEGRRGENDKKRMHKEMGNCYIGFFHPVFRKGVTPLNIELVLKGLCLFRCE
jgi:hypothetical protein